MKKNRNLIGRIRSELHFVNLKLVVLSAVLMLFLGMLTGICTKGSCPYECLVRPRFALSAAGFILFWSLFYLLIGAAVGYLIGLTGCIGSNGVRTALFWMSLLILSNLLWYPIFFGLEAFVLAFLILILHLFLTISALGKLQRISKMVGLVLLVYTVWLFYCLFVNFCVILLNF